MYEDRHAEVDFRSSDEASSTAKYVNWCCRRVALGVRAPRSATTRIGPLPSPTRVSGQRRYDGSALRRLAVIDVAQRAGLSLEEIRELVEHGDDPVSERLRGLAERRLPEIDALIDRAQRVRTGS